MKRLLGIVIMVFALSFTVYAGDIPEAMLYEDGAMVFTGTVESYTLKEYKNPPHNGVETVKIKPVLKIKGDVDTSKTLYFDHCDFGTLIPEKDTEYLFGYINKISFYLFEIEERNGDKIKIKEKHDMATRLQKYLDNGEFKLAEEKRINLGRQISLSEFLETDMEKTEKVILGFKSKEYEVKTEDFYALADNMLITDVKDGIINRAGAKDAYDNILYARVSHKDGTARHMAVSEYGEVCKNEMFLSDTVERDFKMEESDLVSLYKLLPEDAQKALPVNNLKTIKRESAIKNCAISAAVIIVAAIFVLLHKKKKTL